MADLDDPVHIERFNAALANLAMPSRPRSVSNEEENKSSDGQFEQALSHEGSMLDEAASREERNNATLSNEDDDEDPLMHDIAIGPLGASTTSPSQGPSTTESTDIVAHSPDGDYKKKTTSHVSRYDTTDRVLQETTNTLFPKSVSDGKKVQMSTKDNSEPKKASLPPHLRRR